MSTEPIRITVLPDGGVKVETDSLAGPSHVRAERFMAELQRLLGGETVKEKRAQGRHQHHDHDHSHDHDHGGDHHHDRA